jgi:membrane associated rhomboid family serine protease
MRQTQGSMICPRCGKLISVSEQKCPFCGAWNPSLYGYAPGLQKWIGRRLDLVGVIVGACIILYVTALVLQPEAILHPAGFLDILAPGSRALYQLGMTGGLAWDQRWWWTLLTAIYLHGSLLHIFFNVMWIRNLGPAVVEYWGPARSFIIFNVAGVVGFLVSNFITGHPSIGASGAIFGYLAALIVYGRRVGHSALTAQVWQWAIIIFVMGFVMSSVNNWAHAGGFAGGWIASSAMRPLAERREGRAAMVLALLLALLTVAGVVLSFVRVTSILLSHP